MALTPKKKKFVDEYIKCGNQSEAYRKAYDCKNMKAETITNNAFKLMQDNDVATRFKELNEKIEKESIASAQEIQKFLTQMLRGEAKEQCVAVESVGNYESRATIIEKQVTPKDRIKAGELLAKMRGDFNVNLNISQQPVVIVDDI